MAAFRPFCGRRRWYFSAPSLTRITSALDQYPPTNAVEVVFDGPITAGDFTPGWFVDDDDSESPGAVAQNGPNQLTLSGWPTPRSRFGDDLSLTNQPAYVQPGQTVSIT